ncbi:MAG: MlaD family protein [Alistipes senegalensis]
MKREAKIGIFAVAMLIAAWAGIRFLKGFDIFSRNSVYYAAYDQINGVQTASPIMMKGVKIGTVTGISFDPGRSDNVVLQLTVKRQYRIPTDSEAKIFSNSLMGSKAIEITYGSAHTYLEKGRHAAFEPRPRPDGHGGIGAGFLQAEDLAGDGRPFAHADEPQ